MPPAGRVLIIDDDVAFREAVSRYLEHIGYAVTQAATGDAGIVAFERDPADVVVVDIFMPGQGGLQTIDRLRRRWPGAKIVAVSGARSVGTLDVKGHAVALGADRFLEKPFEPATLVNLIAALVTHGS
jgi:two-component system phosphate regulon response regulator OmpR